MYSLISDRFLKRFFGNCLHRDRINPASEAGGPMVNQGDKPTELGYLPGEDPVENEATLENKTSEVNQLSSSEDGLVQPENDH